MLDPKALANSLVALALIFYAAFYLLYKIAPGFFELVFNAQFFGADVAALVPELSFGQFIGILVAVVVVSWIGGYIWGWLYNRFTK